MGGRNVTNKHFFIFLIRSLKKHKIQSSGFYTAGVNVPATGNEIFC